MKTAQESLAAAEHTLKQTEMVMRAAIRAVDMAREAVKQGEAEAAETAAKAVRVAEAVALEAWEAAALSALEWQRRLYKQNL